MTATPTFGAKSAMVFCLWLALTLIFCTTGCVIIPTPHKDSGYARTNLTQLTSRQFTPGQTTREAVILALGEPDAVSMDERQLAYRSEKVVALWMIGGASPEGGGGATGGTIYRERFLVFEFDPLGQLQGVKQAKDWGGVQGMHPPELINSAFYLCDTNPVAPGVSRSAFWLRDTDGFRGLRGQMTLGEAGQFLLTETNLVFNTGSDFANSMTDLNLPLASITNVYLAKSFFLRRLVVRTNTGEVHSFEIVKPSGAGGVWQDNPAMQAACDFIQSKIQPTKLEK